LQIKGGIVTQSILEGTKYEALRQIVDSSGNVSAQRHLKLLLEETDWDFEPFDIIQVVEDSGKNRALEELVVLMSKKPAMSNYFSRLLRDIVESKISSCEGDLQETSGFIKQAIHNEFWREP